jgi:hypothetical protein
MKIVCNCTQSKTIAICLDGLEEIFNSLRSKKSAGQNDTKIDVLKYVTLAIKITFLNH